MLLPRDTRERLNMELRTQNMRKLDALASLRGTTRTDMVSLLIYEAFDDLPIQTQRTLAKAHKLTYIAAPVEQAFDPDVPRHVTEGPALRPVTPPPVADVTYDFEEPSPTALADMDDAFARMGQRPTIVEDDAPEEIIEDEDDGSWFDLD